MGPVQSLIPVGITVNTGDATNKIAMGMSMVLSFDSAMIAEIINGPAKSTMDDLLVKAALLDVPPDGLESKQSLAIAALNAYTELILDCWDKGARTEDEIADLLAQLQNRKGTLGDKIYAKISRDD